MKLRILSSLLLASVFASAHAGDPSPTRYTLEWSDSGGIVTASGFIELDRDLVTTPGDYVWNLPDPAVLDFEVTVSGSAAGDGTFTEADYQTIIFNTNGGALDLDAELVGQPTDGDPWGTPSGGNGGDFNIFINGADGTGDRYGEPAQPQGGGAPPQGTFFFEITANGGAGESMLLTSFRPAGVPEFQTVPTLSKLGIALLLGLLMAIGVFAVARRTG